MSRPARKTAVAGRSRKLWEPTAVGDRGRKLWEPTPVGDRSARPALDRIDHGAQVAAEHGLHRSPEWPRVEKLHLSREPRCRCCADHAAPTAVQVHHIFPFHYCIALGRPDLELDLRNLITLCESEQGHPAEDHHLLVGHLGSFRSSNLEVARDARHRFHGLEAEVLKRLPSWLHEVSARLAPLEEMGARERREFARLMNARLPRLPHPCLPAPPSARGGTRHALDRVRRRSQVASGSAPR